MTPADLDLPETVAGRLFSRSKHILAENQPEYIPLPVLAHDDGRMISRWSFTPEERARIAAGEDLYLTVHTFNRPHPPMKMSVGLDHSVLTESET